jgi:hypothetical protein
MSVSWLIFAALCVIAYLINKKIEADRDAKFNEEWDKSHPPTIDDLIAEEDADREYTEKLRKKK